MTSDQGTVIGDATLTASGIARLANVGRAAVSNWRRRYADFPAPVGGTPTSPSFNAREVEDWLRRQGKLHQSTTEQWAWRHIEGYQPAAQIGDVLCIAGAYLFARSVRPAESTALLTPKQLAGQLRAVDRGLATLVGALLPDRWEQQLTTLLHTIDQLAREQDPETAFEYLHSRYVSSAQSMSGLASTPDPVAEVMVGVAGPGARVLDFTCGTGSILRLAADRAGVAVFAQEIKPQYALIALLRLWFVHRRNEPSPPPVLHVGDSLLADAFADLRADVVVANFPFGIHDWGHDQLVYDPRWIYGMPPRTEPELAWVQHALAHLAPGGTCVVLMPPAAAVRPAGRRIRAELVRRGALRAVVALPVGLMPPAGIGLHIWVLTQPDERRPPVDRLLFVNAAASDRPLAELVETAWHDYRSGRLTDVPRVQRSVPAMEILDDQVDVTPQRHLPPPADLVTDPAHTMASISELVRLLTEVQQQLPEVLPAKAKAAALRAAPQASLADLVRSGSIELLRAPVAARAQAPGPSADNPVLTATDVLSGGPPTGTRTAEDDDAPRVRSGDLLIPTIGREIVARVATALQVGAELGPGVQLLRFDPARFDPWFVAGVLSRSDNLRIAGRASSATSGTLRIDLRRLTIPVLTLQDQQVYGEAFRRLASFRADLERAAAAGATLAREISDGLTSGSLVVRINRPAG